MLALSSSPLNSAVSGAATTLGDGTNTTVEQWSIYLLSGLHFLLAPDPRATKIDLNRGIRFQNRPPPPHACSVRSAEQYEARQAA
ncbi:uncharacterized protein BO80DRAFT_424862 [Aspergillus ibericus CBS 121593]|uniref:Uncharacterized protein n=1 Tax=Aspergillus ibericus CBS 121593 TaxID=1448316 RepID=A0A395H0E6_9EURO|nr:hypothetical protein BO80DRAFT_424862 [Aspergillus ibericus CBS 121593]RAL01307.1 hypothetical protein BO80DRAFT_424862 [Aspergillus ibericus CBS 121593]